MKKLGNKTNFNQSRRFNFALTWADVDNRPYRQEIVDLANKIGRTKAGSSREAIPYGPEYYALEPVLDPFQAKVAMHLEFRNKKSAAEIAKACGEPLEAVQRALEHIAWAGVAFVNTVDGVDLYWHDLFVPGHLEMITNNKEIVAKFPQVAEAFYHFGSKRGPMALGIMPIGGGPMRVIPVERSIDGNSRRASYEEISKHLDESTVFSVSDCSCRTSREVMGEGCGHLKEEMCIQLGHAAEYYIKTGRGRAITREEADEIIRRAEDNGLMHSIPNLDEPGHTHAICNCCGCGCFALRLANEFLNNDIVRSNYRAVVDKEKCVACGECVEKCPTNAVRLGQKLCSKQPIDERITREIPQNTEWPPEKWNSDYRLNRKPTLDTGTAPCITKCPAHIPVQGYIKLAAQGKYTEALELIKKHNPLPAVCGRICPRICEEDCTRGDIDAAVAVDDVKKFIAEKDLETSTRFIPKRRNDYSHKKVVVIGSGPAGLACAYDLAVEGYNVTVFEKEDRLGGMLSLGVPSYRLDKEVLAAEIDVIRELGVKFVTGVEVGRDITIQGLRDQGFSAFFVAIGAGSGKRLGVLGEDAHGVMSGVEFLRLLNLGVDVKLGGKVAVIGGGNVAIDVARSAIRLGGVTQVDLYCIEKREDMPAHHEEVEAALLEGVNIHNSWGPSQIMAGENGVEGLKLRYCERTHDDSGRFNPRYDDAKTMAVACDMVVISVGQAYAYGGLLQGETVSLTPAGTVAVHPVTLQSSCPDIFAGGDIVSGPRYAIDAIAAGKEAAESIHRFVNPGQSLLFGRDMTPYVVLNKDNLVVITDYDGTERQRAGFEDAQMAKTTFKDLRGVLTEEQVMLETARCLSCGTSVVDAYLCVGCGTCSVRCKFDAIKLERVHDVMGYKLETLPRTVLKNVVARKARIALRKLLPRSLRS